MFKRPAVWFALLFAAGAVVSLSGYLVSKQSALPADELVPEIASKLKDDLVTFLQTSQNVAERLAQDAPDVAFEKKSAVQLAQYFSGFMNASEYLHGVFIFGSGMNFIIYRNEGTWASALAGSSDSAVQFTRYSGDMKVSGNWQDSFDSFMERDQLNILLSDSLKPGDHDWRTAQVQNAYGGNMLFHIFLTGDKGKGSYRIALAYQTGEMVKRFPSLLRFLSPGVTLITKQRELLSLSNFDDRVKAGLDTMTDRKVQQAAREWENKGEKTPLTLSFHVTDNTYWTSIESISPGQGVSGFALTLSEADLQERKQNIDEAYLYATILFLLFSLALALPLFRKTHGQDKNAP